MQTAFVWPVGENPLSHKTSAETRRERSGLKLAAAAAAAGSDTLAAGTFGKVGVHQRTCANKK